MVVFEAIPKRSVLRKCAIKCFGADKTNDTHAEGQTGNSRDVEADMLTVIGVFCQSRSFEAAGLPGVK